MKLELVLIKIHGLPKEEGDRLSSDIFIMTNNTFKQAEIVVMLCPENIAKDSHKKNRAIIEIISEATLTSEMIAIEALQKQLALTLFSINHNIIYIKPNKIKY